MTFRCSFYFVDCEDRRVHSYVLYVLCKLLFFSFSSSNLMWFWMNIIRICDPFYHKLLSFFLFLPLHLCMINVSLDEVIVYSVKLLGILVLIFPSDSPNNLFFSTSSLFSVYVMKTIICESKLREKCISVLRLWFFFWHLNFLKLSSTKNFGKNRVLAKFSILAFSEIVNVWFFSNDCVTFFCLTYLLICLFKLPYIKRLHVGICITYFSKCYYWPLQRG